MAEHPVLFYGHLHFDPPDKSTGEAHKRTSLRGQYGEWATFQPASLKAEKK